MFYQYTNRLAHLYLIRELNQLPAFLVFLYFLNATEMAAKDTIVPSTIGEWKSAIVLQERLLGARPQHSLSRCIIHAFVDVHEIQQALPKQP